MEVVKAGDCLAPEVIITLAHIVGWPFHSAEVGLAWHIPFWC